MKMKLVGYGKQNEVSCEPKMRGCAGNGFVLQFFFWCLLLQLNWSAAIYGSQHCCFDSMSDREAVVILDSPRQPLPKRKRPVSFGFILFLFTHTHTPVRHGIGVIVLEDDEEEDHLFMELFSPPRVAIPLRREGFLALHSFDLITGYDFLSADTRPCFEATGPASAFLHNAFRTMYDV